MRTHRHFRVHPSFRFVLRVFLLLLSGHATAQTTRISGKVSDANTGEPLPFVNVTFTDSRISTNTDIDGLYRIETYYATDSIRASCMGYQAVSAKVKRDKEQVVDLVMKPSTGELVELVVRPTENSAFAVLRHVIANKPANDREKLAAYQYESYNKVEFDLNNITQEFTKKRLFKDFAFIFDYVDSTEAKPFLPIFMTETLSDVYYRQTPRTRKEIIRGNRVSGVENQSITQFMGDMYQNISIYNNFMTIFGKNFVSPIADGGRQHYNYLLLDSNWVGHNWCYRIFKPKHKQDLVFSGEMWINDTSYAVRRIDAGIEPGTNLNFVQDFRVHQEYDQVAPEVWMLTKDQLVVDLNPVKDEGEPSKKPIQGFYGRRTASYKDFVINQPKEDKFYEGASEVVVDPDPLSLSADFWDQRRHTQLSKRENDIYHMVDTMKTIPKFRTYVDLINTIVVGYYKMGQVELGPYFKTYSFNAVEGSRFRLGARTSKDFSKWVEFGGYAAYGTKDEEFKYGLTSRFFLTKDPRQLMHVSYKLDIEQLGQSLNAFHEDNILSSIFRRNPATKLTLVNEYMVDYEREWFTGFSNTLILRQRTMFPRGSLEYIKPTEDGTVSLNSIRTTEIALNTRFAYHQKYLSGDFDRVSLGTRYPILQAHMAVGIPGLFRGDYEYEKLVLRVDQRIPIGALGWFHYMATGARLWGAVPYPLLFIYSGNETFYYDPQAFNSMNYFEFLADMGGSLMVDWHMEGLLFNRIPLFRRLHWREVFTAKTAFGSVDRARSEKEMLFLPNMYDLSNGPFFETSVGVENILKIMRVDAVRRLSYRDHDNVPLWALRFSLYINF